MVTQVLPKVQYYIKSGRVQIMVEILNLKKITIFTQIFLKEELDMTLRLHFFKLIYLCVRNIKKNKNVLLLIKVLFFRNIYVSK